METLWQDLRYGLRMLRTHPSFTAVAVIALALGIGANSAIFSVVNAVVLRPLPYPEPERLVAVNENNPKQVREPLNVSYRNFLDWQQQSVFAEIAAYKFEEFILKTSREPEPVQGAQVTASLFSTLGVRPAVGRAFLPEEDKAGAARVAIVSHGFWTRHLGAEANLSGKTITLNNESYSVIGVMPPSFKFPADQTEIWTALGLIADQRYMTNRAVHVLSAVARLKADVTLEQAQTEMSRLASRIQQENPGADPEHSVALVSLHQQVVGNVRPALLVLFGAVGFVLLIACANVSNLLLARSSARQREISIRTALGASRSRVARQLLTESVLLSLMGGALGVLLALWGTAWLSDYLSILVPRATDVAMDRQVLGFTLLLSVLTGLAFGLAPALQVSKTNLSDALKDGSAAQMGGLARQHLRGLLVIAEVALSLVLLIGAGLMIKSFWRLQQVNPGFQPQNLVTMTVSLPSSKYQRVAPVVAFYQQLIEKLARLPGAQTASAASFLPITGSGGQGMLTIEGRSFAPGTAPSATYRRNLPNYFRTLGIPLVEGREFTERDDGREQKVVIINESMARRHFSNEDPLGKRIKVGPPENEPWLTIVGVVGDVKNEGLQVESALATYEPFAQRARLTMNLVVRTTVDPASMAATVEKEVRAAEPDIIIFKSDKISNASTMTERMAGSVAPQRFNMLLLTSFAILALVLAAVGIYGVISYAVTQRTREIGVRMALGAQTRDVLRLVIGQGMSLVLIGVALGLVSAFAMTKLISSFSDLLFDVKATDPTTFVTIALLLTGVALLACYLPARRAMKVDPMVALRYE